MSSYYLSSQSLPKSISADGGILFSSWNSLIHPGFSIGIEKPIRVLDYYKFKNGIKKLRIRETHWVSALSVYHHENYHTNVILSTGKRIRRLRSSGFYTDVALKGGISRTILPGETYTVNDDGAINTKSFVGNFYVAGMIDFGIGYDFNVKSTLPLKTFLSINTLLLAPYNRLFVQRYGIEFGVIYSPKGLWRIEKKIEQL